MTIGALKRVGVFLLFFLGASLLFIANGWAETGPLGFGKAEFSEGMETDRPDFTEGTLTVEPGHLQLEIGYSFTYDDDVDSEEHGVPESLLRVGLLENLELRLVWDGYRFLDVGDSSSDGAGDISVGFKNRIAPQSEYLPAISTILEVGIPTGSREFTSDDSVPAVKLLLAYEFESFALASNVNFASPVEGGERFFETSASLTAAVGITDKVGTYLEYFGFYPNSDAPSSKGTNFLNAGFTYGVNESLQFDILIGFGLNNEAEDFFTGAGVSYRL